MVKNNHDKGWVIANNAPPRKKGVIKTFCCVITGAWLMSAGSRIFGWVCLM